MLSIEATANVQCRRKGETAMMELTKKDTETLRTLAAQYMEYASLPVQEEKRKLWVALNGRHMQKPMVTIDQIPWHEMDVDGSLKCQIADPYWRKVEDTLRKKIHQWKYFPADMVLTPYIALPRLIENSGYGITVQEETSVLDASNGVVGHMYENQFHTLEDVQKIKTPIITVDRAGEAALLEQAAGIFHGIVPIKLQGMGFHLGLWDTVSMWLGVENCYIQLYDDPDLLHAVMERLTNAMLSVIDQCNKEGLCDVTSHSCHCQYTYDDGPDTSDLVHPTSKDTWAFGMAQLFSSVSPVVTEEFEVPYMQKLFPLFGNIYYGCCEKLDDRLDIVDKMPNIRKVSCSPWSDRENFAAKLPKKYIMSNKPSPAFLATGALEEDAVRKDIRRTLKAAKDNGLGVEFLLKDISTVCYQPQRLWRWNEIVQEETLNF